MNLEINDELICLALTDLIKERNLEGTYGLVIIGIEDIPLKGIAQKLGGPDKVFVSLIGSNGSGEGIVTWAHEHGWDEFSFGSGSTHAVTIRNEAPKDAIKLAIVWHEEERLHSLTRRGYKYIGPTELIKQVCKIGMRNAVNEPQRNLWEALTSNKLMGSISLQGILEYYRKVFESTEDQTNRPRKFLPLLDRLIDDQLLTQKYSTVKDIVDRLIKNALTVEKIQRADEEDRQDALRTLKANADETERTNLQRIYSAFLRLTRGDYTALNDITLDEAEFLLSGRARPTVTPHGQNSSDHPGGEDDLPDDDLPGSQDGGGQGDGDGNPAGDGDDQGGTGNPPDGSDDDGGNGGDGDDYIPPDDFTGTGTGSGSNLGRRKRYYKSLALAAIDLTIEGNNAAVADIIEKANESLKNGDFQAKEITISYEQLSISVQFEPDDIAISLNKLVTNEGRLGGVLSVKETLLEDLFAGFGQYTDGFEYYDQVKVMTVLDLMRRAKGLSREFEGYELLNLYIEKRRELYQYNDLLATSPLACLIALEEARNAVAGVISSYERLLSHMEEHFVPLKRRSSEGTSHLYKETLGLDTIKIISKEEVAVVLTALNPMVLWKYLELAKVILERNEELTEEDLELLSKEVVDLPEPLLAVYAPGERSSESHELGFSGRIGSLPIYRTISVELSDLSEKSIGTAGIKLAALYPPVKEHLRLMLVDPIYTVQASRAIRGLIQKYGFKKATLVVVKTNTTLGSSELPFDKVLDELAYENKISIEVLKAASNERVREYLQKKPVHLLALSGERSKNVELIESEGTRLHPLSVPHKIHADPLLGTVSISPRSVQSTEDGIRHPFGLYQSIIAEVTGNPRSEFSLLERRNTTIRDIEALLPFTQFVITLGQIPEILSGDNELLRLTQNIEYLGDTIYTYHPERIISGISDQLRSLNYRPSTNGIKELLKRLQEVGGEGLFTTITEKGKNGFSETAVRGLLGLAVALNWYRSRSNPDRHVVVSLDSYLAKRWLRKRSDGTRSDFLGVREMPDGSYCIDIIEVKSYEATNDSAILDSHADKQLRSVAKVIYNMVTKQGDLLIDRRRELLRLQLYREALQMNPSQDAEWVEIINAIVDGIQQVKINLILIETAFEQNVTNTEVMFTPSGEDLTPVEALPVTRIRFGERTIQGYLEGYIEPVSNNGILADASNLEPTKDSEQEEQHAVEPTNQGETLLAQISNPPEVQDVTSVRDSSGEYDSTTGVGSSPDINDTEASNQSSANEVTDGNELNLGFEPGENEKEVIEGTARSIYRVLQDLGLRLASEVDPNIADKGPSIIRYKIRLQTGERVANLQNRARDLMRELATEKEPMIDNLPNTNYVYIDLPRPVIQSPRLLPLLPRLRKPIGTGLYCPIGVTPDGKIESIDITKLPHMLVAGSTNSGKTMFLYSLIVGLTQVYSETELQLVLVDPKQTDFVFFNGLPHLRGGRVITEPEEAVQTLLELLDSEVRMRTEKLLSSRSRDIKGHNERNPEDLIPPILVLIDEFADLADVMDRSEREAFDLSLRRLAQRARNVGIHLIVATQRPTTDIVNGTLKSNLPCRISFKLASQVDSRTILDKGGAENLLGNGDMLFSWNGKNLRLQGFFLPEDDIYTLF